MLGMQEKAKEGAREQQDERLLGAGSPCHPSNHPSGRHTESITSYEGQTTRGSHGCEPVVNAEPPESPVL